MNRSGWFVIGSPTGKPVVPKNHTHLRLPARSVSAKAGQGFGGSSAGERNPLKLIRSIADRFRIHSYAFFHSQGRGLLRRRMKGMGLLMTLLLIFPPLLFGNSFALSHEEATNILKELVQTEFNILEIREAPLENFWEVVVEARQGKVIFYIHKSLRYIFQGQVLDRQAKRNLTLDRIKDFRRINPSSLSLENAIPMGEGKRKLYVFTDPQCYFCFQLHEEIKQIKDLQVFFFLYPLTLTSYEKAKSIWCSQDKVKSLEEAYQGKEVKSPSCDTSPIDRNMEFGRGMLIDSTPTLLFQNGKIMEGYPSPKSLEDLLKSNSGL